LFYVIFTPIKQLARNTYVLNASMPYI